MKEEKPTSTPLEPPKVVENQQVKPIKQEKENKKTMPNYLTLIILAILFLFVLFLPNITNWIKTYQANKNDTKVTKTSGVLSCYFVKENKTLKYDISMDFTYVNEKLKQTTQTTTYTLVDPQNQAMMKEKQQACNHLATILANVEGITFSCDQQENTQITTQKVNYQTLNPTKITENIAELDGFYIEYELDDAIKPIKESMKKAGYTCVTKEK